MMKFSVVKILTGTEELCLEHSVHLLLPLYFLFFPFFPSFLTSNAFDCSYCVRSLYVYFFILLCWGRGLISNTVKNNKQHSQVVSIILVNLLLLLLFWPSACLLALSMRHLIYSFLFYASY